MSTNPHSLLWVRPSRVARRLFLHVFAIGSGQVRETRQFGSFEKPGAGMFWVVSGHGQLRVGLGTWELRPGPYLWFYGTHRLRVFTPAPGETLVTRTLWFGGPGLEAWLEELDVAQRPEFRLRRPSVVHRAFAQLLRLIQRKPPMWEWKAHLALTSILDEILVARNLLGQEVRTLPREITQVLNAIEADSSRDWKASELAARAGMGYSAFRVMFRNFMRETPHEYIQRARLDLARELLADRHLRVKEVAQRLHFSSEYYFSNFFRQKTGVSPTEFRSHLGLENPKSPSDKTSPLHRVLKK